MYVVLHNGRIYGPYLDLWDAQDAKRKYSGSLIYLLQGPV